MVGIPVKEQTKEKTMEGNRTVSDTSGTLNTPNMYITGVLEGEDVTA